ncbi:MAG: hypothetical protein R3300_21080, partial [Candidatus Promineifilaceae bacterium]|nr:hypothetical protein [Candidatus Promineifilaceae bacterium]
PPYTDDRRYLEAFDQLVPPLVERFDPDVLVTQLGVDTHAHDPLANLLLSTRGQEHLFRRLAGLDLLWLALGGGGYELEVVPRAWALAWAVMSGQTLPEQLPEAYRERYGGRLLHDQEAAQLDGQSLAQLGRRLEKTVDRVRRIHELD